MSPLSFGRGGESRSKEGAWDKQGRDRQRKRGRQWNWPPKTGLMRCGTPHQRRGRCALCHRGSARDGGHRTEAQRERAGAPWGEDHARGTEEVCYV